MGLRDLLCKDCKRVDIFQPSSFPNMQPSSVTESSNGKTTKVLNKRHGQIVRHMSARQNEFGRKSVERRLKNYGCGKKRSG
jgi:hypothetical protein